MNKFLQQLRPVNIAEPERLASGILGALFVVIGLSIRRLPGWLMALAGGGLVYRGLSGHCTCYDALGISTASEVQSPRISVPGNRGIKVEKSVMIYRAPEELYRTWRNFENLPHFMKHLESVQVIGDNRSRWIAKGPAGMTFEWDAEIVNEHENEMISWRSLPGADVDSAGTVRFKRVPGGTEVRVSLEYDPPAGAIGATLAKFFHEEPSQQVEDDLFRFKHMMESAG